MGKWNSGWNEAYQANTGAWERRRLAGEFRSLPARRWRSRLESKPGENRLMDSPEFFRAIWFGSCLNIQR